MRTVASAGLASAAFGGFFTFVNNDAMTHRFGAAVSLPIFDGGLRQGRYGVAVADYDLAVETYNQTVLAAFRDVANQVVSLQSLARQQIDIAPWLLHHHKTLWDDPMRFDPDRFLPERSAGRPRLAYMPFGAGPRVCIGQMLAMNEAITRFLPDELASLREALDAAPITLQNLPAAIRRDWFAADGRVHLQVSPTATAQDTAGLRRFVDAVQAVAPDAGGPAVTTIASADTIMHAFRQAAVLATLAIALVLLVALRHLRDSGIVLLTLAMSALLTALLAYAAGMAINYANIIALPLLLGVGVSFNVYFVMNWRAGMRRFVGSASARAVLFSALTTGTAFGSLALSHDRGMASMGSLLLLSLVAVLLATFAFLPALLYTLAPASPRTAR